MMAWLGIKVLARIPVSIVFTGISLAVGFLVPTVFECFEESAVGSHFPRMELAGLGALLMTFAIWAGSAWFGSSEVAMQVASESSSSFQFSLRTLFIVTTLVAFALAAGRMLSEVYLASSLVVAVGLGLGIWSLTCDWCVRGRFGAVMACSFFPYLWMIAFNKPIGSTSGLIMHLPLAPSVLPAVLIGSLFGNQHPDNLTGFAAVMVVVQLALGFWLAKRGGKLAVAYLTLLLMLSSVGSLGFHALYRS